MEPLEGERGEGKGGDKLQLHKGEARGDVEAWLVSCSHWQSGQSYCILFFDMHDHLQDLPLKFQVFGSKSMIQIDEFMLATGIFAHHLSIVQGRGTSISMLNTTRGSRSANWIPLCHTIPGVQLKWRRSLGKRRLCWYVGGWIYMAGLGQPDSRRWHAPHTANRQRQFCSLGLTCLEISSS